MKIKTQITLRPDAGHILLLVSVLARERENHKNGAALDEQGQALSDLLDELVAVHGAISSIDAAAKMKDEGITATLQFRQLLRVTCDGRSLMGWEVRAEDC